MNAIAVQARVIGALILREMVTRYGRQNIGFAWLFIEPMLFTLAIAWLWSLTKLHTMPGLSIVAFAVTGYSSILVWRNAASRCTGAVKTNWALLYHRNVTPLDIFAARIAIEVLGASFSLISLSATFVMLGWMAPPADLFAVTVAWLFLAAFGLAFALVVGAASELSDVFERVWHVLAYLLFPLSGAVWMAEWLPEQARQVVLLLPMVHGVEMLRSGWFGDAVITHEDPAYMLAATLVIGAVGLFLVRLAGRRVEPQ